MKTLLRIDSSLRLQQSYSRNLADYFVQQWQKLNQNGSIIKRDVTIDFMPHLNQQTLNGFYDETIKTGLLGLSDTFIEELYRCNELLICSPVYNFGIPSSLKAYFDLVVRSGKTFRCEEEQIGLLQNKKAYVISVMGDKKEKVNEFSLVERHLEKILNYIGISEVLFFTIDGTAERLYAEEMIALQKSNIIKTLSR